jgi:hypothetical protein
MKNFREVKYWRVRSCDSIDKILRGTEISFDKQFRNLRKTFRPGRIIWYDLNSDLAQDFREMWREYLDTVMNLCLNRNRFFITPHLAYS